MAVSKRGKNTIFIGFRCSGKTTYGQFFARQLAQKFIDTDREVESLYFERYDQEKTCREIYEKEGAPPFRKIESQVLLSIPIRQQLTIATGGGIILLKENRAYLKKLGRVIYLQVASEELWERNLMRGLPSFLNRGNFMEIFEKREHLYREVSDEIINMSGGKNG